MSIINQMLKDLARRHKSLPSADELLVDLVTTANVLQYKNKISYGFILLTIFSVIVIFLIIPHHATVTPSHTIIPVKENVNSDIIPVQQTNKIQYSSSIIPPTVGLTGITLQVEKGITSFRFLLNQSTLYHVDSIGPDQFAIILENTSLATSLPQIDTASSAIHVLRITSQQDGSLKILFKLNPGAELTLLGMRDTAKFSELQIDFMQNFSEEQQQIMPIKRVSYDSTINDEYQKVTNLIDLSKFLIKYPDHVPARKSLAVLLMKKGNLTKALDVVNIGLVQQPLYLPYLQLKAEILMDQGKMSQALEVLQAYSPPFDENPEYYSFIAALLERQHKFSDAINLYERLLNLQPNNSIWWVGLGIAFESLGKKPEALAAFQKVNKDSLSTELKAYVESHDRENYGT